AAAESAAAIRGRLLIVRGSGPCLRDLRRSRPWDGSCSSGVRLVQEGGFGRETSAHGREVRQSHAHQADTLGRREYRADQIEARLVDLGAAVDEPGVGLAAGGLLEV